MFWHDVVSILHPRWMLTEASWLPEAGVQNDPKNAYLWKEWDFKKVEEVRPPLIFNFSGGLTSSTFSNSCSFQRYAFLGSFWTPASGSQEASVNNYLGCKMLTTSYKNTYFQNRHDLWFHGTPYCPMSVILPIPKKATQHTYSDDLKVCCSKAAAFSNF